MSVLLEVWRLLDRRRRQQLVGVQLLSLLMALCTVGGLAAILPFFTVLADPQAITRHSALRYFFQHGGFTDERQFALALGVAFAAVTVLTNAVNLCGSLAIDRFSYRVGDWLHVSLFEEYLQRGYGFHVSTNSALLTSRVLRETGRVTGGVLRHCLILVTNAVTALCIVVSIMIFNPTVATGHLSASEPAMRPFMPRCGVVYCATAASRAANMPSAPGSSMRASAPSRKFS